MYLGRWKLSVAPAEEPVTLSELKAHLRLGSEAFGDRVDTLVSIAPDTYAAASTQTGTSIEVFSLDAVVNLHVYATTVTGVVTITIQHSDDGSTWSTFTTLAPVGVAGITETAYTGTKRYIRANGSVANDSVGYGVTVLRYQNLGGDEDTYLENLLTTAREQVEEETWRALITQTWTLKLDEFPDCGEILLPRPPCQSVTSISYQDTANVTQTLAASQYTVITDDEPGRIVEAYNVDWPDTYDVPNAVTITYVAGYGLANAVPKRLKHAIMMLAAHWYENREAVGSGFEMPLGYQRLIRPLLVGPRR